MFLHTGLHALLDITTETFILILEVIWLPVGPEDQTVVDYKYVSK